MRLGRVLANDSDIEIKAMTPKRRPSGLDLMLPGEADALTGFVRVAMGLGFSVGSRE